MASTYWSDLPLDILLIVKNKLRDYRLDLLSFRSVCSQWRSAMPAPGRLPSYRVTTMLNKKIKFTIGEKACHCDDSRSIVMSFSSPPFPIFCAMTCNSWLVYHTPRNDEIIIYLIDPVSNLWLERKKDVEDLAVADDDRFYANVGETDLYVLDERPPSVRLRKLKLWLPRQILESHNICFHWMEGCHGSQLKICGYCRFKELPIVLKLKVTNLRDGSNNANVACEAEWCPDERVPSQVFFYFYSIVEESTAELERSGEEGQSCFTLYYSR